MGEGPGAAIDLWTLTTGGLGNLLQAVRMAMFLSMISSENSDVLRVSPTVQI